MSYSVCSFEFIFFGHFYNVQIWFDFYFLSFNKKCEYYEHKIKEGASMTLLKEYEAYLYDTDGLRPKYDRKKNW